MSQVGHTTARALLRRLAVEQAECRVPSLTAAIVRDGRLAWFGGRGRVRDAPPTAATQYRIGSITKSMVAVVVMRLRDEGALDLTDPLQAHLPGAPHGHLTIAQLLSHTGGLTAEPPTGWWERTPGIPATDLLKRLGPGELKHRPGRRFHYSNVGFALLGELIAHLRGTTWLQAVHAEVLTPLGMNDTTAR
ncbi:beta-lactamase family protein, partial [Nonomuraea turkmeniaca]